MGCATAAVLRAGPAVSQSYTHASSFMIIRSPSARRSGPGNEAAMRDLRT
jgi:hypothetical protein